MLLEALGACAGVTLGAVARLPKGVLLLFNLGFVNYGWFEYRTDQVMFFVTRSKTNAVIQMERVLQTSAQFHDQIVWLGSPQKRCQHLMHLVEVEHRGRWYRYLTDLLDPLELPAPMWLNSTNKDGESRTPSTSPSASWDWRTSGWVRSQTS
jgi:hypothetical protein